MKRCVLLLICMCCLAGCQATPEQVKKNKENYNANEQIDFVEINHCSLEELSNTVEEALNQEYENIVLPKQIDFSMVEEVNEVTFTYAVDFLKNKEEVAKMFGYENLAWEDAKSALENDRSQTAENFREKYYVGVGDNGWATALKGNIYDRFSQEDNTTVKAVYKVDRKEGLEENCMLSGEQTTIKEQVSYVEEWFEKEWKHWEPEFDYKVSNVIHREEEGSDNHILMMEVDKFYHGVLLDPVGGKMCANNERYTLETVGASCLMGLSKKDSWDDFINCTGLLMVEEKHTQEKFIDFASAVRIVEKELSGFRKLDVSDVKIMYTLKPIYDSTKENANYHEPGGEVYARPVYCFFVDREYEDLGLATINLSEMYYFVQVDMITGEVTLKLSMGAYGASE